MSEYQTNQSYVHFKMPLGQALVGSFWPSNNFEKLICVWSVPDWIHSICSSCPLEYLIKFRENGEKIYAESLTMG